MTEGRFQGKELKARNNRVRISGVQVYIFFIFVDISVFSFKRPASFRLSTLLGKNGHGLDTKKKSSSMSNLTETRVG